MMHFMGATVSVHNYVHDVLTWPQKVDHSWPNQETGYAVQRITI